MKNKIFKLFLIIPVVTMLIAGCGNKDTNEKYQIDEKDKVYTEGIIKDETMKKIDFTKVAKNSNILEIDEKYAGVNFKDLKLASYFSKEYQTLDEIIENDDKPTVLINLSPYCLSCKDVDYQSFIILEDSYNVIFAMSKDLTVTQDFDKKGITNQLYVFDPENLADDKGMNETYTEVISRLGNPAFVYLNKNKTAAFYSVGEKDVQFSREVFKYLN